MCMLYAYKLSLKKCVHPNYYFYCFEFFHRVCSAEQSSEVLPEGRREAGGSPPTGSRVLHRNEKKQAAEDSDKFYDVTVGPDLTKKQRDEEAELRSEAERRNEELTEEDVQKNLHWAVVGARGENAYRKRYGGPFLVTIMREGEERGAG